MTEHLDKTTITRLAWLTELRRQGYRKCEGDYGDYGYGGPVCALGLLVEVAGVIEGGWEDSDDVGKFAGLSSDMSCAVVLMNDGDGCYPYTFAEIADVVEGWFQ